MWLKALQTGDQAARHDEIDESTSPLCHGDFAPLRFFAKGGKA